MSDQTPNPQDGVGDPSGSGSVVEPFLGSEVDDARKDAALLGALPRLVNADVLSAALGHDDPEMFAWLRTLPFVTSHADGLQYEDVIRASMLQHVRRESPSSWQAAHDRLAHLFRGLVDATGLTGKAGWRDPTWARYAREEAYHLLCASRPDALVHALHGAVDTHYWSTLAETRRWTEMIVQAGRDAELPSVAERGESLLADDLADDGADTGTQATTITTDRRIAFLTTLADDATLDAEHRAQAFADRGNLHEDGARYDDAIRDLTRAIDLDPAYTWAIARRGETHRLAGRYDEALTDLTRAIDLDPSYTWAIASRGATYRALGRYEDAHTDFTRAIDIDPAYTWAIASRGETHRLAGRYDEALTDFTRAIDLDPSYTWAIIRRGQTYQALGRYDEAIADLTRAIDLDPDSDWIIAERGETLRLAGQYEKALADFTRAIDIDPSYTSAIISRGQTYQALGRYDEAIADFARVIDLDPTDGWIHYCVGLLHRAQGNADDAREHFHRALSTDRTSIESSPFDARVWFNVAVYLLALDEDDEAEAQLRATLGQGASRTDIDDAIDDIEELHQATERNITRFVTILTDFITR